MMGSMTQGLIFLIQVIFGLYGTVILLRLLLRMARADYHNPVVQAIVKLTGVFIKPLKRVIPDVHAIETASVVLFIIVDLLKLLLLSWLSGVMPNLVGLVVWALGDLFASLIQLMFYLIVIRAIFSWFQPNPMIAHLLQLLTNPVLRPIQKHIPPLGGLDLTPLVAIILLQLINIVLVSQIVLVGRGLALS